MAYVAEMILDGGDRVLLEIAGPGPSGVERVGRGAARAGTAVAGAAETLQQALARVRPALAAVVADLGLRHRGKIAGSAEAWPAPAIRIR